MTQSATSDLKLEDKDLTTDGILRLAVDAILKDRSLILKHLEELEGLPGKKIYALKEESAIFAKLLTSLQNSTSHLLRIVEIMNKLKPGEGAPEEGDDASSSGLSFSEVLKKSKEKKLETSKEN